MKFWKRPDFGRWPGKGRKDCPHGDSLCDRKTYTCHGCRNSPAVIEPPPAKLALRGRIFRCGLTKSGEVSVTMRFGLDELEAAKTLLPGMLIQVVEIPEENTPAEPAKDAGK